MSACLYHPAASATKEDVSECRHALSEEIATLRRTFGEEIAALKVDAQTIKSDLVRWVFVAIMGQTAMLLGVLYFFMKHFK